MKFGFSIESLFSGHKKFLLASSIALLLGQMGWAYDNAPACMGHGQELPVNNAQVLYWKRNTPNQFLNRGHVTGIVNGVFNAKPGHDHFEIQIGSLPGETLEVVYNSEFGSLPDIRAGMKVEACGDYITSIAQSGPYPASPSGAIIHWVHSNPSGRGHDSGFLMIDGTLYGMGSGQLGLRRKFNESSAEFLNQNP